MKKTIALFISLILLLSCINMSVLALDTQTDTDVLSDEVYAHGDLDVPWEDEEKCQLSSEFLSYNDLIGALIKENASSLNNPSYYIDYTIENAFDNFTVTNYLEDEAKTIFSFNCKAKEESDFVYSEGIKVGNYYIQAFKEGAYYVIDNRNDEVYSLKDAYDNKVINDADLDYLYENCAYKAEERQIVEAATDDEALNEIIKEKVNPLFSASHHELEINDGTFADLKVYNYFTNESIIVFRFKSSSNEAIDGVFDWLLGKYGFVDENTGNEIYVYDKVNDELLFLNTAYENEIITDEVLEELAESYFQNRVDKAVMRLIKEENSEANTDTDTDTNNDEIIKSNNEKIIDAIKAEAQTNPKYADYKDLEFNDFTFNVHYKSGLAGGIYIFDYQAKGEAYFQAIWCEKIGDYVFTYWHGGKDLYAVYNLYDGEAKFGKLRELYENGEIGDDVFDDFYKNPGGASIHKVGDINRDNNIDIVDVVIARNIIVNGETFDFDQNHMIGDARGLSADVNNDQSVDIVDVVILRNIIVNG